MATASMTSKIADLKISDLKKLADKLIERNPSAVDLCIEFVLEESKGSGHNRARALICRRLKHCQLNEEQRSRLVFCIINRLELGLFYSDFKDQLHLALNLDLPLTLEACKRAKTNSKEYIRNCAEWALSRQISSNGGKFQNSSRRQRNASPKRPRSRNDWKMLLPAVSTQKTIADQLGWQYYNLKKKCIRLKLELYWANIDWPFGKAATHEERKAIEHKIDENHMQLVEAYESLEYARAALANARLLQHCEWSTHSTNQVVKPK